MWNFSEELGQCFQEGMSTSRGAMGCCLHLSKLVLVSHQQRTAIKTPRLSYQYLSRCFFNFLAVTVVHGRMIPLNRTTLF
jgi:hypothetical protein